MRIMMEMTEEKFIEETAQAVFDGLTPGDKKYLIQHPETWEHHFGLGLYIRNEYIHGKKLGFFHLHADDLSSKIVARVILMAREERRNER